MLTSDRLSPAPTPTGSSLPSPRSSPASLSASALRCVPIRARFRGTIAACKFRQTIKLLHPALRRRPARSGFPAVRSVRTRALSMQRHVHEPLLTFLLVFPAHDPQDEEAAKPAEEKKPEPIGPPRGAKVRLSQLRFPNESRPRPGRVLDTQQRGACPYRARARRGRGRATFGDRSGCRRPALAADNQIQSSNPNEKPAALTQTLPALPADERR